MRWMPDDIHSPARGQMSKLYSLNLTKRELWVLSQGYAASFTDPDGRDEVEVSVSDKLTNLYQRAHKEATAVSSTHQREASK